MSRTVVVLVALSLALPAASKPRPDRPGRGERKSHAAAPAPAPSPTCKEPAAKNADLAEGLALYAKGSWRDAATKLQAWASAPEPESDPAAARGYYALSYALRASRMGDNGTAALATASRLLERAVVDRPTLEGWYYLQGVRQMNGNTAGQLQAVSSALQAIEAGTLCPTRDGDDWFRISRLYEFAGNAQKKSEALTAAAAAYDAQPAGSVSPYRGLTERALGDAAMVSNDLESAETHLSLAAKLDPSMPGVHRALGLVLLRRGKVQEAADHWRSTWQMEGESGNMFLYALPIMNKVLYYRAKPGVERMTGLSTYTVPALEQDAVAEAKTMLSLRAEADEAKQADAPFPAEKQQQMETADYRMNELLLEYVTRGNDVQEFALQNGLLPAIHGHGLPSK